MKFSPECENLALYKISVVSVFIAHGKSVATISKKLTFFIHEYSIDGEGIEIEGDAFSHNYEITKFGSPIAYIHKEWFTWGDSYCIDIASGIDELLAVSIAITIDSVMDRNGN